MAGGFVYIMSNGPSGTLDIGVTSQLAGRVWQHREGVGSDFCREHGLVRLVYAEPHETIEGAIVREKQLKKWKRAWKLNLIGKMNPDWRDMWDDINNL